MRVEQRGLALQPKGSANQRWEEPVSKAKPFEISKRLVWDAYRQVRANRGAAGVDGVSLAAFEKDLEDNLYKVWNRMSSGSYHPPPVRLVEIPKDNGGQAYGRVLRTPLGIPTVGDRVAQTVVKRAVAYHTDLAWVRLYVGRWLRAAVERPDGSLEEWTKGTPQGGVVSPLLANLFLHYGLDLWMQRTNPGIPFERYADDVIVHCRSYEEASSVLEAIRGRLAACGLELHPTKTKIVYCKDDNRRGDFEQVQFDFLGYGFQPRRAKNRQGQYFVSFLPAISTKAAKAIRRTIREWRMGSTRNNQSLEDLARLANPAVRGWIGYYGRFYCSLCSEVLRHLNLALAHWVRRKFKRYKRRKRASMDWLGRVARRDPRLFVHWQHGARPLAGG